MRPDAGPQTDENSLHTIFVTTHVPSRTSQDGRSKNFDFTTLQGLWVHNRLWSL